MGKYTRKTLSSWTEDDMQKAIKAFREGRSQRHAADLFGVPHSCLQRRLQSGQDKPSKNKGRQTTFTAEQENELVSRILKLCACGFGLDCNSVRRVAFEFAESNHIKTNFSIENRMAGSDWLAGFRKRNPSIALRKAEGLSFARCNGLNKDDVVEYFSLLKETMERLDLLHKPNLIYNADESGCAMNNKPIKKVFAEKGSKAVYSQTCVERGELVTILACTNATGNFIPPMAIFKGKKFHKEFSDGFPNGSLVTMTDSGWINEDAFLSWLHHFQKNRVPGACLLLVDGHASHKSLGALTFCDKNDINMVCLPSHTTHRLQPLDRSFFKPLKAYYDNECNKFVRNTQGERKINKITFGRIFKDAWLKAATPAIAESGFRSTGIYPLNEDILSEQDFFPSVSITCVADPKLSKTSVVDSSTQTQKDLAIGSSTPNSRKKENLGKESYNPNVSFHDLLPSPIKKGQEKRPSRKQKAVLLTSEEYIQEKTLGHKHKTELVSKGVKKIKTLVLQETSSCVEQEEQNDTICNFCSVSYRDPRSPSLGDWVQCQGKSQEWYHEKCVGAEKKKVFVCGRCKVLN